MPKEKQTYPARKKNSQRLFQGQQDMHARASLTWGAGRNHRITTDVQEEGEAGRRQKRQKEGRTFIT